MSHLIEDGVDPLFVQQQIGHSWASTTAIYTTVGSDAKNQMLPTSYPRTQLLVACRVLGWLDQRGLTLSQCRQGDVDSWLADGPAGYPVRDFLGWAADHHHCPVMLVPTPARTTGAAIDPYERWMLLDRLLHDDTIDLADRVVGALLLCYGQPISRIAVMGTEQVHSQRDPDIVSLRFADHDIIVAEPLSGLLTDLIDLGRRGHGLVSAHPTPARGRSQGTYQDGPPPDPNTAGYQYQVGRLPAGGHGGHGPQPVEHDDRPLRSRHAVVAAVCGGGAGRGVRRVTGTFERPRRCHGCCQWLV